MYHVSWSIKSVQVGTWPNKQQYKISSAFIYRQMRQEFIQNTKRLKFFQMTKLSSGSGISSISEKYGSEETNKGERCP